MTLSRAAGDAVEIEPVALVQSADVVRLEQAAKRMSCPHLEFGALVPEILCGVVVDDHGEVMLVEHDSSPFHGFCIHNHRATEHAGSGRTSGRDDREDAHEPTPRTREPAAVRSRLRPGRRCR